MKFSRTDLTMFFTNIEYCEFCFLERDKKPR